MIKLFCILDVKAGVFQKPFADESTINAIRGFTVAVNESDSNLKRFPDDFCLMELGSFDSQSGALVPLSTPLNLGSGRTVVRHETPGELMPLGSTKLGKSSRSQARQ